MGWLIFAVCSVALFILIRNALDAETNRNLKLYGQILLVIVVCIVLLAALSCTRS